MASDHKRKGLVMAIAILPWINQKSEEEFNKRVDKTNSCWMWTGAKDKLGYGRLSLAKNIKVGAHRFSYALTFGIDPADLCVCHRCDNPGCINPEHLFLGTHKDNSDDKFLKGRAAPQHGQNNGASKLTEEAVEEIKIALAAWMSNTELGKLYGVHHSQISAIKRGVSWHEIGTPHICAEYSSHVGI